MFIRLEENDKVRYFEERRTGRTTRMLKKALTSKKKTIFIVAPTLTMSKHLLFEMFAHELKVQKIDHDISMSKLQVKVGDRTFIFTSEDRIQDCCHYKGYRDYDIYRDHTCYELDN